MLLSFFNWDASSLLSKISCPVLVGIGDNDSMAAPEQAKVIHNIIQDSTLISFPAASHFLISELALQIAQEIYMFVNCN